MNANRNLTINLPDQLIHRLRVAAAVRNQSMTAVVRESIERTLGGDNERQAAALRLVQRLKNAPDRGIGGAISWTRDELHER